MRGNKEMRGKGFSYLHENVEGRAEDEMDKESPEEYTKEYPDKVLLRSGDVLSLESFSELKNQHLPEEGKRGSAWVFWRGRQVYFTGIREGDTVRVITSGDKGYVEKAER